MRQIMINSDDPLPYMLAVLKRDNNGDMYYFITKRLMLRISSVRNRFLHSEPSIQISSIEIVWSSKNSINNLNKTSQKLDPSHWYAPKGKASVHLQIMLFDGYISKSSWTRYVDGTPTSEDTPVTMWYICQPHHIHPTDAFPFRFTSIGPTIPEIWPQ